MSFDSTCVKTECIADDEFSDYRDEPEYVGSSLDLNGETSVSIKTEISKKHDWAVEPETETQGNDGISFQCHECKKVFKHKYKLIKHTGLSHGGTCDICTKSFRSRFSLVAHIRTHTEDGKFTCRICKVHFSTIYALKGHTIRMHGTLKELLCPLCPKISYNKSEYFDHRDMHFRCLNLSFKESIEELKAVGFFTCPICKKKITGTNNITLHLDIHSAPNNKCQYCDKMYTYVALNRHYRKLHKAACLICNRLFVTERGRLKHERRHFNVPLDTCGYCAQVFENGELLHKHMQLDHLATEQCPFCVKIFCGNHLGYHVSFKHFKCKDCRSYFCGKEEMLLHYKYRHLARKEYTHKCKKCKAKFLTKSRLALHMNSVHLIMTAFTCTYCKRDFQRYRMLEKHLLQKHQSLLRRNKTDFSQQKESNCVERLSFRCKLCYDSGECLEQSFKNKHSLNVHIGMKHPNFHPAFSMKLLPHRMKCYQCEKIFTDILQSTNNYLQEDRHGNPVSQDLSDLSCPHCGREFKRANYSKIHIRKCCFSAKNVCLYCPFKAEDWSFLLLHMNQQHYSSLPDKLIQEYNANKACCPVCNREFCNVSRLHFHMSSHFDSSKLYCHDCGKKFQRKISLILHIRKGSCMLSVNKKRKCAHREELFTVNSDLLLHTQNKHEPSETCEEITKEEPRELTWEAAGLSKKSLAIKIKEEHFEPSEELTEIYEESLAVAIKEEPEPISLTEVY